MANDDEVGRGTALLQRIVGSPRLPSLPAVALQLIALVQREDVNVQQIAEVIRRDPALTSKLLRTVNSSFYGQPRTISTISQAVVVLGLNAVKTLALGFSLVANLKKQRRGAFDHVAYWKRSLYTATAARHLARRMGLAQQEEAFLGGLLQDLGVMVLSQELGATYAMLVVETNGDHAALCELERDHFGFDHAEVGGALAGSWSLPPLLVGMIRHHEAPGTTEPPELLPLVNAGALGGGVAEVFTTASPGLALAALEARLQQCACAPVPSADELLREVHHESVQIRALFDLPTGALPHPDEILVRANETVVQLSLQTQRRSTQLEQQNRRLAAELTADALTGVANRRRFDEFSAAHFDAARVSGQPLSLLFLDADDFKSLNDRHGHQAGDRVLTSLAALLRVLTPETGMVARYGGEEFALVLPGVGATAALALAERIRAGVESLVVRSDEGEPLRVTVSIGAATQTDGAFRRLEELIRAADSSVYAAKRSGRNRVHSFTPPRPAPAAHNGATAGGHTAAGGHTGATAGGS